MNAKTTCLSAVELMARYGVSPQPHNYEIFYNYVAGGSSELRTAVDLLVASGRVSDQVVLEATWAEFLAPDATKEVLELSDKLSKQIAEALGITSQVAASSAKFGEEIGSRGNVKDMTDPSQIAAFVDGVIRATAMMERQASTYSTDLASMNEKVERLQLEVSTIRQDAVTDALTKIGNRRHFDLNFSTAINVAREAGEPLTLCIVDLDHFKQVNDQYGHATGDQVLRLMASVVKDCTREGDIVARYGGEEFVIAMPGTSIQKSLNVVERIRLTMENKRITKRSTSENIGSVTASFGLTQMRAGDTAAAMIERADKYLYEAKENGRNRIETGGELVTSHVPGSIISRLRTSQPPRHTLAGQAVSAA